MAPEQLSKRGTGYTSGAKKRRKKFLVVTLHFFGSTSTISRFGERFRDGRYSFVSFLFAFLLLTMLPPRAQSFVKVRAHAPVTFICSRRHCLCQELTIPSLVTNSDSLTTFKSLLITYLFRLAFHCSVYASRSASAPEVTTLRRFINQFIGIIIIIILPEESDISKTTAIVLNA